MLFYPQVGELTFPKLGDAKLPITILDRHPVSTPCAGREVPGFASNVLPPIQQWAVPAQAGEAVCLPLDAGLFRSAVGPHSVPPMHPLQSPPSPSHQTASPASLRCAPAPWSLGDSLPAHTIPSHPSCRQRDSQQPRLTHNVRPNLGANTTDRSPLGGRK